MRLLKTPMQAYTRKLFSCPKAAYARAFGAAHARVCACVHMCACVYVCVCACTCVCACAYVCVRAYMFVHVRVRVCAHVKGLKVPFLLVSFLTCRINQFLTATQTLQHSTPPVLPCPLQHVLRVPLLPSPLLPSSCLLSNY